MLREHAEDVPLLVEYYAKKVALKLGIPYEGASMDAIQILKSLPWPGNIRELKNMIETMITLEKVSYITPEVLRKYIPAALPAANLEPVGRESSLVRVSGISDGSSKELELIFRTLLELKTELNDVKRYIHSLSMHIQDLRNELEDNMQTSHKIEDESTENISQNLNLANLEKQAIVLSLKQNDGNRRQAAIDLGISERTLYRKITEYDL